MKRIVLVLLGLTLLLTIIDGKTIHAAEQWQGVDEAVVGKFAREHGREAKKALIDTGEGDLQLFAFLMAGVVGGFAAGYCWRSLLDGKKRNDAGR